MKFLVALCRRKAYGRVEFNLAGGQIGIVKFEQHFKPDELATYERAPGNASE